MILDYQDTNDHKFGFLDGIESYNGSLCTYRYNLVTNQEIIPKMNII